MIVACGEGAAVARVAARLGRAVAATRRTLIVPFEDPAFEVVGETTVRARDDRARIDVTDAAIEIDLAHCGGRPVFALATDGVWLASTRLAPLVSLLPSIGANDLDLEWLAARLAISQPQVLTRTPYRAIIAAPGSSVTTLVPGRAAVFRAKTSPPARPGGLDQFREAIDGAIARGAALGHHHGVLTGGIDSSSVAGLLARVTHVQPFSLDLGPADMDRPYVEELGRLLGSAPIRVARERAARALTDDLTIDASPDYWPTAPHIHAAARLARESGIDVLWSGLAGDQLLEGSPRAASTLLREGRVLSALSLARASAEPGVRAHLRAFAIELGWSALRARAPYGIYYLTARRPIQVLPAWAGPAWREHLAEFYARSRIDRPAWEISREEKVDRLLHWNVYDGFAFDRRQMEAFANVIRIDPYTDPDVVRAAASLEEHELVRGGLPRAPIRELVKGLVPESVRLRRDKAYFEDALEPLFDAVPVETWRSLASASALADLRLVDPRGFAVDFETFATQPSSRQLLWLRVWAVLTTEAFIRGIARLPGRFVGLA